MIKKMVLIAAISASLPQLALSQITTLGPPSQQEYDSVCRNRGEGILRQSCEINLRLLRGVATCEDINWTYSCDVDQMSDKKKCSANGGGSNLFVFATEGKLFFGVIGDEHPGEPSMIRVDKNSAISFDHEAGTTRTQNLAIEAQIRKGKSIRTRYSKWPSGVSQDQEVPVCNLPDIMTSMKGESR